MNLFKLVEAYNTKSKVNPLMKSEIMSMTFNVAAS